MPILVILIIFSLAFYIYFKIKYIRTKAPAEKRWISAKSSMTLGTFISLFGVNQLFLFHTTITYIVASIFIILGMINIWGGYRAYRYFLPLAAQEAQDTRKA
jgi:hypothetical protein